VPARKDRTSTEVSRLFVDLGPLSSAATRILGSHEAALPAALEMLHPGGRLALNIFNPSITSIAAWMGELSGGQRHLTDYRDPASGRGYTVWQSRRYRQAEQRLDELRIYEEIDRGRHVLSKTYRTLRVRYFFGFEMEHLLRLAGFEVEALYGWFDRRPFDERSTEMVWIARRPDGI